jgi:hypothetical protein
MVVRAVPDAAPRSHGVSPRASPLLSSCRLTILKPPQDRRGWRGIPDLAAPRWPARLGLASAFAGEMSTAMRATPELHAPFFERCSAGASTGQGVYVSLVSQGIVCSCCRQAQATRMRVIAHQTTTLAAGSRRASAAQLRFWVSNLGFEPKTQNPKRKPLRRTGSTPYVQFGHFSSDFRVLCVSW